MRKYFRVWWLLSVNSFQTFFISRIGAILFLSGKILRTVFFLFFIVLLFSRTDIMSGYNLFQILLFYMTFNFIDSFTQMLFREVYRFRQYIISGNFDMMLVKPINVLFRSLFGWTDILDFVTLGPLILIIGFLLYKIPGISFWSVLAYLLLITNSMIIAAAFHIFVLGLAVLTTEIDHAIMIYRDVVSMGKIPVDIYSQPVRSLITFVIPVGIMMTFPVKALLGLLTFPFIVFSVSMSLSLFAVSIYFWNYTLKKYTSASS